MKRSAITPNYDKSSVKVKLKKCKICSEMFAKRSMSHVACSTKCAIDLINQKKTKADKKETKLKLEALEPLEYWLKRAEAAFNAFIRKRDEMLPCISCGRTNATVWNAGHYIAVGANRTLRFNEDNVHKQCARPCNKDLGGNSIKYRIGLREKIGEERVNFLEGWHPPVKMTREFAQEIEKTYKAKLKDLQKSG